MVWHSGAQVEQGPSDRPTEARRFMWLRAGVGKLRPLAAVPEAAPGSSEDLQLRCLSSFFFLVTTHEDDLGLAYSGLG